VAPGQDGDPAAAGPAGPATGPPDQARAETYLRLRVEAELRRVQALPRPDPPGERELPAPLRGAARLVTPPARRAASVLLPLAGQAFQALQPLAENTGRALRPLADTAGRTLPPLAGNAAQALQPLADTAAQTVTPIAGQVIGAVLPVADRTAQQLRPLAWQAAYRLQALRYSGQYRLMRWPRHLVTVPLRGARAVPTPAPWLPADRSVHEGVRQLRRVADALVQADAIDRGSADSVLAGLETALAARSRIDGHLLFLRDVRAGQHSPATTAPAGRYLAAPVGVTTAAGPDSGLTNISLFTLVLAPDRAVLTVAGQMSGPPSSWAHQHPWPLFPGPGHASVTDDRGNDYDLRDDSGWTRSEGDWGAVLSISPVPPAGTQWLELIMRPGFPAIRVDLGGPSADDEAAPARPAAGLPAVGSPAGQLIDTVAEDLLRLAVTSGEQDLARFDLSDVAEIVIALDAVGALAPARDAVDRLLALAGRLGVTVPPALSAAARPGELPAAWTNMLENRHRRDGRPGAATAAAVLPELDGVRFVVAGLRSHAAGASLRVLGWGRQRPPRLHAEGTDDSWSWYARDDQGRWHMGAEGSWSSDDHHMDLQLDLIPPLHPETAALELILGDRSGRVTATVQLDWMELA